MTAIPDPRVIGGTYRCSREHVNYLVVGMPGNGNLAIRWEDGEVTVQRKEWKRGDKVVCRAPRNPEALLAMQLDALRDYIWQSDAGGWIEMTPEQRRRTTRLVGGPDEEWKYSSPSDPGQFHYGRPSRPYVEQPEHPWERVSVRRVVELRRQGQRMEVRDLADDTCLFVRWEYRSGKVLGSSHYGMPASDMIALYLTQGWEQ